MYSCDKIIIVEGKYDKSKLSTLVNANILICDGFRIFTDVARRQMMLSLAQAKGAVLLLDSDVAGFKIRSYLRNFLKDCQIIDVFIPDIYGKEKRKVKPSKEGKLGVEGVPSSVLIACLKSAGVFGEIKESSDPISKLDLYNLGLIGGEKSVQARAKLLKLYNLPENMPPKSLLRILNQISSLQELKNQLNLP